MKQAFPEYDVEALGALHWQLRCIARAQLASEECGHTLQPTALVHEAALRLLNRDPGSFRSVGDYAAAAAEAMRRVLVDHARRRDRLKRGGGARRLALSAETLDASGAEAWEICAVDDALSALSGGEPGLAEIVRLRVFGGLTAGQIGACLGMSRQTVERRWRFAAALLRTALDEEERLGG